MMSKVDQMRSDYRNRLRREELDQRLKKVRTREVQRQKEDLQFQQNGTYGQALISDILTRSKKSNQVNQLRQKYTLQTFSRFLDEPYDNSENNIQEAVIIIIQSYFYQGFSQQPSQHLIDQLLRLLQKSNYPIILKHILLIFNSSLLDHYKFSNLLIRKNFVPLILAVMENFVNNQEVMRLVYVVIGSMVQRADWSGDLMELVDPMLRAINNTTTIDAERYVETIYHIARLNPELVGQHLYKKGILGHCLSIIERFKSRPASYLYFQFCSIFKGYLKYQDIGELMRAISYFRKVHFQVGEMSGKYSVSSIKNSAYNLVLYFLTTDDQVITAQTQKFMQESSLRTDLIQDLREVTDPTLLKVLGNINLHFYKKSQGQQKLQYRSAFESAIANWSEKDACFQLQTNYETITKFHLLSSGSEEMQVEI